MNTSRAKRPVAARPRSSSGPVRGLAAALLALAGSALADPTLSTHFSQATYDVDVRAGSELLGWSGFSGIGVTSYSTMQALTGDGVILQSFPGQFVTRTQQLKLHFQSKPGHHFDNLSMSHLLSYFNNQGGFRALMSWTLDTEDGPAQSGATPLWEDNVWFHGGSFADTTQPSPLLTVDDDAFDLDVTLFYTSAGFPGGCSTVSGVCQQIGANAVKIWVQTAVGDDVEPDPDPSPVPAPPTLALLLGAALALGLRRRATSAAPTSRPSAASGAWPAIAAQRA